MFSYPKYRVDAAAISWTGWRTLHSAHAISYGSQVILRQGNIQARVEESTARDSKIL